MNIPVHHIRQALGGPVPIFFPASCWQSQMWSVHLRSNHPWVCFSDNLLWIICLLWPPNPALLLLFSCCHVWLFVTPWSVACWASLSFIISQNFLKFMFSKLEVPSNHLILCHPLLLPSISPTSLQWVDSLQQVAKVLELQLQHQSFQWRFKIDFL